MDDVIASADRNTYIGATVVAELILSLFQDMYHDDLPAGAPMMTPAKCSLTTPGVLSDFLREHQARPW